LGKLKKLNLKSERRVEGEEECTDFFASEKRIFEEEAKERAILCLTSGHSCDVAR